MATPTPPKLAKKLAPLAVLPPLAPTRDAHFTDSQWATLLAILDCVLPRILISNSPEAQSLSAKEKLNTLFITQAEYDEKTAEVREKVVNPPDEEIWRKWLSERAVEVEGFEEGLTRMLVQFARKDQRDGLAVLMTLLNTRAGSLLLTGYATPITDLPVAERAKILTSWRTSRLAPIRGLYKSFTMLAKTFAIRSSPLFSPLTGYSPIPHNYTVGESYPYTFLQFPPPPSSTPKQTVELNYDVVIIGSGIGGGVSAKRLAEAGLRVLVVDKAYHYPAETLPMTETLATLHQFENGGVDTSYDGSLNVISGSAWGGGGTVNWSASLQPQAFVRHEWAVDRNLPLFQSEEFQEALDRVCERMGVSADPIRHNHGNRVLLEASRKLGLTAKAVPQNSGGAEHYCGHCTLGCASCEKQGPANCWLVDAANAGAEFIEGLQVDKILFANRGGKKTAVGIKGVWTSRNPSGGVDGPLEARTQRSVIVKAKRVVLSAGSMWSPTLLLKSGLKNPHIGKHLYMHPVNTVSAIFPSEVRPWEGAPLTTVCSSFENLDGHGHGVKIEATCMLPGFSLNLNNWENGLQFKGFMAKYKHLNTYICIVRDRDPGSVKVNAHSGLPEIHYTVSDFDAKSAMVGVLNTARLLLVGGASEILVNLFGTTTYVPKPEEPRDINHPRFVAWLKEIEKVGNKAPDAVFMCAHQMGSSRMSARPNQGVVDPTGRVWESEGLYVMDASVFPSASGVNPMVTNLGISWVNSGRLAKELKAEVGSARL